MGRFGVRGVLESGGFIFVVVCWGILIVLIIGMESFCCGEEIVDDSFIFFGVKMFFLVVVGCCIFDIVVIGLKLFLFDL